MSDLLPTIQSVATGPRSASVDGASGAAMPLRDLIEADAYAKSAAALQNRSLGIRYVKLRAPGSSDINLGRRVQ